MSLIPRLRQHFQTGFLQKPYVASIIGAKSANPSFQLCRNYGQPAMKEDEDQIEFDPRRLPADYDPAKFDPTCHRNPPSDRVFRLVDEVSSLTLKEASELASILMKKMGMTEAPVIGVLKAGAAVGLGQAGVNVGADAQEEKKPEKTVFELKLEAFESSSKIKVIKEIRAFTDLGLKEAKALVEKAPAVFKTGVSKEEAAQIIEKMKAVGANVVME
ncbi:hypothetical protein RND81_08G033800 [Saponaria officinalis]|uniref:Large ribosomal subunit protein bL12 C-terminal domain-containing protein n=1 Tax=Saponaria officinalis TaxID=3572 RepID=A0AAW1J2R5_SAPOF